MQLARTPQQIGNLIQRTRRSRGMSQSDLGSRTGLRQSTISLIEQGNAATKLGTVLNVLAALDLEFCVTLRSKAGPAAIEEIF